MEDYDENDRWDWDHSDSRQYCEHGTFIGSWWGPDILCWACESGMTVNEYDGYMTRQALHRVNDRIGRLWPYDQFDLYKLVGYWDSNIAMFMETVADRVADELLALYDEQRRLTDKLETLHVHS